MERGHPGRHQHVSRRAELVRTWTFVQTWWARLRSQTQLHPQPRGLGSFQPLRGPHVHAPQQRQPAVLSTPPWGRTDRKRPRPGVLQPIRFSHLPDHSGYARSFIEGSWRWCLKRRFGAKPSGTSLFFFSSFTFITSHAICGVTGGRCGLGGSSWRTEWGQTERREGWWWGGRGGVCSETDRKVKLRQLWLQWHFAGNGLTLK